MTNGEAITNTLGKSDDDDNATRVPLLSTPEPPSTPLWFLWYHYAILATLASYVGYGVWCASRSLASLLLCGASFCVIGSLLLAALRLKPAAIPTPFLVSQLGSAALDMPFNLAVLVLAMFLAALFAYGLYAGTVLLLLYLFHPSSASTLLSDMSALTATIKAADWAAADDLPIRVVIAYMDIWADILERTPAILAAGVVYVGALTILLLVFGGALAAAVSLELLKWRALTRCTILRGAPTELGVDGIVCIGLCGAHAFSLTIAVTTLATLPATARASSVFAVTTALDALVVASSQLLVATAYAEREVLASPDTNVRRAVWQSVLFNFVMLMCRATPAYRFIPTIFVSNFPVFATATLVRAAATFVFSSRAHSRYCKALQVEREMKFHNEIAAFP